MHLRYLLLQSRSTFPQPVIEENFLEQLDCLKVFFSAWNSIFNEHFPETRANSEENFF